MQKGDSVIADHIDSRGGASVRFYGVVQEITQTGGVIIKMADGSLIDRHVNSIAVYIKIPPNWQELFARQIVCSSQKRPMVTRKSKARQRKRGSPDVDSDSTSRQSVPMAMLDF